jgi:hypothetical protein
MNEQELREKIAREIEQTTKYALENCACLGRNALQVGPGEMTTTYVERMTNMILNQIKNGRTT